MFPTEKDIARLREQYPEGTRIQVDYMGNDPHPITPGTNGTVKHVDDIGTIHCVFDNGRSLGLIPGEDSFHVLPIEKEVQEILNSIDEKRDAFWVFSDQGEVLECYYNPDCNAGGQFVFNSFTFDLILEAEKESEGDVELFFDCIQDRCYQELVDIDDTVETVRSAAEEFMSPADLEGYNKSTMDKLVCAAHTAKDKHRETNRADEAR